jgi:immunoglobulin-binding protein 1
MYLSSILTLLDVMLDFHIASCLNQIAAPIPADRIEMLELAISHYQIFIDRCEDYGLYQPKLLKPADAAASRMQKIARYKEEKATRAKIADLHDRISRMKIISEEGEEDDVESVERELTLAEISLSLTTTAEDLGIARDEVLLLKNAPPLPPREEEREAGLAGYSERLDMLPLRSGPLISPDGKPLRPFVITSSKRQEILEGVFRPGHNLPTMSLDDYLDAEFERGNIISGGGPQAEIEVVEESEEVEEAAMYKARAWDDFKDANPRGWGNKGFNRG